MERFIHGKVRMAECRICSSETAQEEEENNILKEHVTFNEVSGHLQAKYQFKNDPAVLIDNGKEAKACQISQEKCQVHNKTHDQYVKQFKDMLNRGVVSEITHQKSLPTLVLSIHCLKDERSLDLTVFSLEIDPQLNS